MKPAMRFMLVALVAASVLTSGCSFVFVQSPHVVEGKVQCTHELTYPIIDAAVGVTGVLTPFILDRTVLRGEPNFLLYIPMWAAGLAASISAVSGVSKVKRCRRAVSAPTPA